MTVARDRATARRGAASLRRHGGLPGPRDPRRYEFRSPRARDRAVDAAREAHGGTCVEAAVTRPIRVPVRLRGEARDAVREPAR